jgi:hypothetical protein
MRLNLIQIAFLFFFGTGENFPQTGRAFGICDSSRGSLERKTLWLKNMGVRGGDLCMDWSWAIRKFPEYLQGVHY